MTSQNRDIDRVVWNTLEHQGGRAIGQRTVDDVAVAGDPADIGRAPVDVAIVIIEHVLVRHRSVNEISTRRVDNALGRAR